MSIHIGWFRIWLCGLYNSCLVFVVVLDYELYFCKYSVRIVWRNNYFPKPVVYFQLKIHWCGIFWQKLQAIWYSSVIRLRKVSIMWQSLRVPTCFLLTYPRIKGICKKGETKMLLVIPQICLSSAATSVVLPFLCAPSSAGLSHLFCSLPVWANFC